MSRSPVLEIDLGAAGRIAGKSPAKDPKAPDDWTPEWVDVRLTEAFATLMRVPAGKIGPATIKTVMPVFAYSQEDRQAQAENPDFERDRRRAMSRHGLASPGEIARMEDALGWPMRFLKNESPLARAVCWSSFRKAVKREDGKLHLRLGVSRRTFFRYRLNGLQAICDGLKRDGRPCA